MMRSSAFPPRRPSHLVRYIIPSVIVIYFLYYMGSSSPSAPVSYVTGTSSSSSGSTYPDTNHGPAHNVPPKGASVEHNPAYEHKNEEQDHRPDYGASTEPLPKPPVHASPDSTGHTHPIDALIKSAQQDFDAMMAKEASSLKEAASAYRARRGRHPPPGFKAWYEFAKEKKSVMVEDFFDQIYHDLGPFWGVDPKVIRKESWDFEMTINIRNGKATAGSDWFWTQIWLKLIQTVEHELPDMDLALNAMDEPRLVVPWEDIEKYMEREKKGRKLIPTKDVLDVMVELPPVKEMETKTGTRDKKWENTSPYWDIARRGCPPDSPARKKPLLETFDKTPVVEPTWATPHQYQGYVSNFSLSTEFCHQPDLQGLEGIFIHPLSTSATKTLFPMFGGSKLATNNEILLPAPMYWNEEERFTGGNDHGPAWADKKCDVVWRGVGTGGKNTETTWKGFQRHRFVSMNNGTSLTRAAEGLEKPVNFALPAANYDLMAVKEKRLGEWVSQFSDVGLTDLMCDDAVPHEGVTCPYTDPYFSINPGKTMREQFDCKFLPDIDGNSFSGRYLGFLRSTSLPIKSTLWREWHDSRLVAWKHFVPMDNRFGDFYGIMEYFLGYGQTVPGHDAAAQKIAMEGKEWAEKVLRKEDMQVYVLRLLLEFARVSDPRRERMGWVDDL
ncbi:uncharacterized protein B0I36DRAFT_126613 [Microdochium trichocladiopsis]|uniref:Glycosyl transferase CAP10 domain-containing protein n=1 Tax=Microdochium trichocladiopsis TaxID=1682393 RepID=A0A9P8Y3T8_9PEZI|nr:uncharacterized protein B0I36DRAFT_126613 [Microdochium trichocladiopsis]KAH7028850.1 hypothetical protein B0I36DRAFT_126613 [Microdochium trichocladiopsis]